VVDEQNDEIERLQTALEHLANRQQFNGLFQLFIVMHIHNSQHITIHGNINIVQFSEIHRRHVEVELFKLLSEYECLIGQLGRLHCFQLTALPLRLRHSFYAARSTEQL